MAENYKSHLPMATQTLTNKDDKHDRKLKPSVYNKFRITGNGLFTAACKSGKSEPFEALNWKPFIDKMEEVVNGNEIEYQQRGVTPQSKCRAVQFKSNTSMLNLQRGDDRRDNARSIKVYKTHGTDETGHQRLTYRITGETRDYGVAKLPGTTKDTHMTSRMSCVRPRRYGEIKAMLSIKRAYQETSNENPEWTVHDLLLGQQCERRLNCRIANHLIEPIKMITYSQLPDQMIAKPGPKLEDAFQSASTSHLHLKLISQPTGKRYRVVLATSEMINPEEDTFLQAQSTIFMQFLGKTHVPDVCARYCCVIDLSNTPSVLQNSMESKHCFRELDIPIGAELDLSSSERRHKPEELVSEFESPKCYLTHMKCHEFSPSQQKPNLLYPTRVLAKTYSDLSEFSPGMNAKPIHNCYYQLVSEDSKQSRASDSLQTNQEMDDDDKNETISSHTFTSSVAILFNDDMESMYSSENGPINYYELNMSDFEVLQRQRRLKATEGSQENTNESSIGLDAFSLIRSAPTCLPSTLDATLSKNKMV